MKKSNILVALVIFSIGIILPLQSLAGEFEDGSKDHQGFFLGLGLGGGVLNIQGGGASSSKGAFFTDLKIGGGINEEFLLMYNGSNQYTKIDGVTWTVYTLPIALQWFFYEDFYVRPGIGLSFATASLNASGVSVSAKSAASIGLDFAAGHEFRLGRYFSLSPELVYHYAHIRSSLSNGHVNTFGVQASMNWYF